MFNWSVWMCNKTSFSLIYKVDNDQQAPLEKLRLVVLSFEVVFLQKMKSNSPCDWPLRGKAMPAYTRQVAILEGQFNRCMFNGSWLARASTTVKTCLDVEAFKTDFKSSNISIFQCPAQSHCRARAGPSDRSLACYKAQSWCSLLSVTIGYSYIQNRFDLKQSFQHNQC